MPRRRPAESRPLRDEPPAFLCAIGAYSFFSGKCFGLLDPVVALDAALEGQLFVHIGDLVGPQAAIWSKWIDAVLVQQTFHLRTDARDPLEIVGLRRAARRAGSRRARPSGTGSALARARPWRFAVSLLRRSRSRRLGGGSGIRVPDQGGLHARLARAREDVRHAHQRQLLAVALASAATSACAAA